MKLTILGAYGPYPAAGGACSGYLLEHEGYSVLFDCGSGVVSRLQQFIAPGELGAVIISHLHSDHFSDLAILRYPLLFGLEKGEFEQPLPVYAPAEPAEEFLRLPYKNVFAVEALTAEHDLQLGPFSFAFLQTVHSVPCYAAAVYLDGEKKLVYSADTEYFPVLSDFARGAELFLCEANFLEEDLQQGANNHLTARQAARLAREADAGIMLLTHLLPFRDPQLYLEEAGRLFNNVEIAREGVVYDLGGPAAGPDRQLEVDTDETAGPGHPTAGGDDVRSVHPAAADFPVEEGPPADWLELTVKTESVTASLVAGRLEEEGIAVFLKKDEAAGSIYGLTTGPLANIRVLVPASQIERARRLLEEIERG